MASAWRSLASAGASIGFLDRELRDRREQGAFGQRQLIDCLVEIDLGCGLNAVSEVAVVVGVEIPFQNLIFGIARPTSIANSVSLILRV